MIAAPESPAPNHQRGSSMNIAPANAATDVVAVATEFIAITCSRGTTCGSAALSPEDTNRVNPLASNALNRIGTSERPAASRVPTTRMTTSRPMLAPISTRRRSQRSSRAPANGPSSEYGRNSTANAAAIAHGVGLAFRVEQNRPGDPGLEKAVPELADRAQLEQPPELG